MPKGPLQQPALPGATVANVVIENPSAIPAAVNVRVALAEGTASATVAVQAAIPSSHCLIECIGTVSFPLLWSQGKSNVHAT